MSAFTRKVKQELAVSVSGMALTPLFAGIVGAVPGALLFGILAGTSQGGFLDGFLAGLFALIFAMPLALIIMYMVIPFYGVFFAVLQAAIGRVHYLVYLLAGAIAVPGLLYGVARMVGPGGFWSFNENFSLVFGPIYGAIASSFYFFITRYTRNLNERSV